MNPSRNSGQVVVEYILIMTVMVAMIMGVFWSVLERRVDEMKRSMETRLQQVISQDRIGIPIAWFGLDRQEVDTSSVRFNPGGAGGEGEAEPEADNDPDGGAGGGGSDPDGSGPDLSPDTDGRGGPRNTGSPTSSSTEPPTGSGGSRNQNEASGGASGSSPPRSRQDESSSQSASREGEFEGEVSEGRSSRNAGPSNEAAEGKDPQAGGEAIENQKQRYLFGRKAEAEGDGCGNLDMFTLMKLGAFVAILLLLFAVMVTAKGQKGD